MAFETETKPRNPEKRKDVNSRIRAATQMDAKDVAHLTAKELRDHAYEVAVLLALLRRQRDIRLEQSHQ